MGELKEKGLNAVVEDFMNKPIGPVCEVVNGREIWGRPHPSESSSNYVGGLTLDERFDLLREAAVEGVALSDDDVYMMGTSGEIKSFSDLVSYACSVLLTTEAEMIPAVMDRDGEQSAAFDASYE